MPASTASMTTADEVGEPTSTVGDRARGARMYLFRAKPVILGVTVASAVLVSVVDPAQVKLANWLIVLGVCIVQAACMLLLRVRPETDPTRVAGLATCVDGTIVLVALGWIPYPVGPSASMAFFIVAASYFLSVRETLLFALWCTGGLVVAANVIDAWNEPWTLPPTAYVAMITGMLCGFIKSRVRLSEQRMSLLADEQLAARARLELVDRSRDRLIANVSHELRTPLTSTIGSIETLLRPDLDFDPEQRASLMHLARDGGMRLLALVEDLLTLGATRPDSLDLSTEAERLAPIARDAVAGVTVAPGRTLHTETYRDAAVQVDRLRLLQVLTNLIVNAERHGAGAIVVETDVHGARAVIRVLDEGKGIADEHLDELFLPFARFSTRTDSTGLGLAICRTIVEAHGGTIGYSRTDDARTCFTVELPLATAPA